VRKVLVLLVLICGGMCATSATAAAPTKFSFSISDATATLSGVCSFDVDITSQLNGFEIDYFDSSGALTRIYDHVTEQDVFSHGGKTLTGLPYTFNIDVLVDSSGNVTHIYASGETSKVPLPNGAVFFSAGRADFTLHPDVTFLLSPDKGNPGDVAAFCAALA
jgi:hypothetical protein